MPAPSAGREPSVDDAAGAGAAAAAAVDADAAEDNDLRAAINRVISGPVSGPRR
jgi:hypothetical protein